MKPGHRFGVYEVSELLGAGGMGQVYKARDTRLDRTVAVKVSAEKFSDRFEREARSIAALNHPNICTLFDVGSDYLVMEYIEGEPLSARLERGPLPLDEALRCASQIAAALDAAHSRGIVHRDLKPANVMLTKAGVKLLDFGLAKPAAAGAAVSDATMTVALTGQNTILGTLQYMAPEQLEGKSADARSDIFAFGALLYEMLTGRRAFEGASAASVIGAIMTGEPAPLSAVQPLAPASLNDLVRRCLAKDPDLRWQSARDLRWQLESPPSVDQPPPAADRRSARLPWAIAAALALACAAIAFLWLRTPPAPRQTVAFQLFPPENSSFSPGAMALSPDGRHISFVAVSNRAAKLFVRALDSLQSRAIADADLQSGVFWSPDSRHIGFVTPEKMLSRIPLYGGVVQALAAAPNLRGAAWGKGVIVYCPQTTSHLYAVSEQGGPARVFLDLATMPGANSLRWPHFLPGGDQLLFVARNRDGGRSDLFLAGSEGKVLKRIAGAESDAIYAAGHLFFMRGRELTAQSYDLSTGVLNGEPTIVGNRVERLGPLSRSHFTASQNGSVAFGEAAGNSTVITLYDNSGRKLREFGEPNAMTGRPVFSPDGTKLAFHMLDSTGKWNIRLADLTRGLVTNFTSGTTVETSPLWSLRGERLYFLRSNYVHWRDVGTIGQDHQIQNIHGAPVDFSPDGRYLLTVNTNVGRGDLEIYDLSSGVRIPFPQTAANEGAGSFSPDGKWIAYGSDEQGERQVFVQAFGGAGKWQVTASGGYGPLWSADGRTIYYRNPAGAIMAVALTLAPKFAVGEPRLILQNPGSPPYAESYFDMSQDGKFFAISGRFFDRSTTSPITVLVNWKPAQ